MTANTHTVRVVNDAGDEIGAVKASVARPARSKATVLIAHGAGGTMDTPSIVSVQKNLVAAGITAVRFNFLYSQNGKKAPDKQATLVATWRSVADWVRRELKPKKLFLSGRSMGGRMASYLVADGYPCAGIFFLAYPLHPPGKPEKLRKDHLPKIEVPMLFVSGTRDAFAQLEQLGPVVKTTRAKLHLIEGADHGFKVPKKYGRSPKDVDKETTGAILKFIMEA